MDQVSTTNSPTPNASGDLLESVLNSTLRQQRPHRVLVGDFQLNVFANFETSEVKTQDRSLLVRVGDSGAAELMISPDIRCRYDELPFEDHSFNMIVLHYPDIAADDGVLDELQRILAGGGQLIILGRGRWGKKTELVRFKPSMNAASLSRRLQQKGFQIRQCEGFGIRSLKCHLSKPWQSLGLQLCNQVMIRAEHKSIRPVVTPFRFSQPQAAGVRSAALDGLNREAV
jgi:SAM-dependent methyltransferase